MNPPAGGKAILIAWISRFLSEIGSYACGIGLCPRQRFCARARPGCRGDAGLGGWTGRGGQRLAAHRPGLCLARLPRPALRASLVPCLRWPLLRAPWSAATRPAALAARLASPPPCRPARPGQRRPGLRCPECPAAALFVVLAKVVLVPGDPCWWPVPGRLPWSASLVGFPGGLLAGCVPGRAAAARHRAAPGCAALRPLTRRAARPCRGLLTKRKKSYAKPRRASAVV